ncbi:hypothetical protein SARC_03898 [Sphaeroforma arctica JP610]|uniref:Uncharacterized protein n=1 Tax=Sphaeroforma arctica JP610 TaxID=667725 RepID=A0A0L0G6L1_9EUKA|nr:hypothetical protein SARC_03898 [Sphaeroforma arctica JP610]KNC83873.1 hypothetical protein SARC_03898 [Sphaeroforma arctica JP610]|eukprot:XP_014157775.1 hypothetical protein SARC_03898 [Sphaeroforma arctica JP610]
MEKGTIDKEPVVPDGEREPFETRRGLQEQPQKMSGRRQPYSSSEVKSAMKRQGQGRHPAKRSLDSALDEVLMRLITGAVSRVYLFQEDKPDLEECDVRED